MILASVNLYVSVLSVCVVFVNADSLRLIHVLFRHGARSQISTYPNDIYTESDWPQGFAQLSKLGIQQLYGLGEFLRERYMYDYSTLLNDTYINKEIYVRSSDMDRCLMSATSKLAGMYPPHGAQVWNPSVKWQPIPVHARAFENDPMLAIEVSYFCPRYVKLYEAVQKTEVVQGVLRENKQVIEQIGLHAGYEDINLSQLLEIRDALFSQKENNMALPEWVTSEMLGLLNKLDTDRFNWWHQTPEMTRLRGGRILGDLLTNIDNKVSGTVDRKLYSYSTHDSTLTSVAFALGIWENVKPSYGSGYLIELHEPSPQVYTVKVFLRNGTKSLYPMTVKGCSLECPLSKFKELVQPYASPSDEEWQEECQITTNRQQLSGMMVIIIVVMSAFLVLCVVVIGVVCYRSFGSKRQYYTSFNS